MQDIDFFYELQTKCNFTPYLRGKIQSANPDLDWKIILEQDILHLSIEDFRLSPKIVNFIERFKCHDKLNIYRLFQNTCYGWHRDHIGREAALNMLIDGWDSITLFGNHSGNPRKFNNIVKLPYSPDKFFLINVHKWHSVFNFANMRYVLSIGIPSDHGGYQDALDFIKENNL